MKLDIPKDADLPLSYHSSSRCNRSMVRDVLLMLSTDQPPDPLEEIRWHADHSANGEKTVMATTRILSGMTRGKSIVAFYGNSALGNRLLGYGTFAGYARSTGQRGKQLLAASELYQGANRPRGIRGVIELINVRLADVADTVDSLTGIVEGSLTPLSLATIPEGPARLQIYFGADMSERLQREGSGWRNS